METKKHFKYEGCVDIKNNKASIDVKITGYQFLVPCKVNKTINGDDFTQMVNVNLIDQKVYDLNGEEWSKKLTDDFFNLINKETVLPEDFYSADQETVDQADDAKREFDEVRNQQYGEVF